MQLTHPVNLGREFDRFFDGLLTPTRNGQPQPSRSTVPAELRETDDRYEVRLDLPGFRADDVQIDWDEDHLTVAGHRNAPELADGVQVIADERRHGEFRRVVRFAENVDRDAITASLVDGVLTIVVPKVPKPEARRIEIRTGN